MSNFGVRQDLLEATQEQSCRTQDEALSELREVINEVVHGGTRSERDKSTTFSEGEIYSPHDRPFEFSELVSPVSNGFTVGFSFSRAQNPHVSLPSNPRSHVGLSGTFAPFPPLSQVPLLNPSRQTPTQVSYHQTTMPFQQPVLSDPKFPKHLITSSSHIC